MSDLRETQFQQLSALKSADLGKAAVEFEKLTLESDLGYADRSLVEGSPHARIALSQCPLHHLALRSLFAQGAVGSRELGGAFRHAILQLIMSPAQFFQGACPLAASGM